VTDNAGHEILGDLCLADFLVSKCGVTNVGLNVKPFPWFVSDVTCKDLEDTISKIENHELPECQMTGKRWRNYLMCSKDKLYFNLILSSFHYMFFINIFFFLQINGH
jgi:hypothetical protein